MTPTAAERDATRGDDGYFHAPAQAQSSLKLAFMHAADQLRSRSVRTNELIDSPGADGRAADGRRQRRRRRWAVATGRGRRATTGRTSADPRAAADRPRGGAARGARARSTRRTRARRWARGPTRWRRTPLLQLVCGDATFARSGTRSAEHHYQRYLAKGCARSPRTSTRAAVAHLHRAAPRCIGFSSAWQGEQMQRPLDAQLEYICSMLVESYPAAQVMQAARTAASSRATSEGWLPTSPDRRRRRARLPDLQSAPSARPTKRRRDRAWRRRRRTAAW